MVLCETFAGFQVQTHCSFITGLSESPLLPKIFTLIIIVSKMKLYSFNFIDQKNVSERNRILLFIVKSKTLVVNII